MTTQQSVRVRAPGKVNLSLVVGGVDSDGYHSLATVFQAVSLFDDLIASDNAGNGIALTLEGEGAAFVPLDKRNLVWRAIEMVAEYTGREPDVAMHIIKGIPVAGGMAGGSADAAAALVACDELWNAGIPRTELTAMAARLGADVPFALHGGVALGLGRGDKLTSVLARGSFHWVFALADGGLSTPAVFAELDAQRAGLVMPEPRVTDDFMAALRAGDARGLGITLSNDLEAAALSLRPDLAATLQAGRDAGVLGAMVSGSGPTCAFLCKDAEHAIDVAVTLSSLAVCRTVRTAHGPVPGARVIEAPNA